MLKLGDKVKIKNDREFLSDLESDLREDVSDRSLSGRAFNKIMDGISDARIFVVTGVENSVSQARMYEVSIGSIKVPYVFEEKRFEKTNGQ